MPKTKSDITKKRKWVKNCPECGGKQSYCRKWARDRDIKNATICENCPPKSNFDNILTRSCPKCDEKITATNKYNCARAIREEWLCRNCNVKYNYTTKRRRKVLKGINLGDKNAMKRPEIRKRVSEALKGKYVGEDNPFYGKKHSIEVLQYLSEINTGENNPRYGKPHTPETKRKMRLSMLKNLENRIGQFSPNYNSEACIIIDWYNMYYDLEFQHAENGGEFYLKEVGFWADGYDKKRNIWIEVDEKHHFDVNGNLKQKDVDRQKEIENFLGCEFIRVQI